MEKIIFIALGVAAIVLNIVSIGVQTVKRTINQWAKELIEKGEVRTREASEISTVYSINFLSGWCIEIDRENKFYVLRNQKIRNKVHDCDFYRTNCIDVLHRDYLN
jgi:hypothetical protein